MKLKLILTILFCLAFSINGKSASFDCKTAKPNIETIICNNSEISKMDENLSKLYFEIKIKAKKPKILHLNQLEWLEKRDKCFDEICLKREYESRNEFLTKWLEYEENPAFEIEMNKFIYKSAINDLPSGSAMKDGYNLDEKFSNNKIKLEEKHDELIKLLISLDFENINPSVIPAIKDQQNAWNNFIIDECHLIGILSGAGGSWPLNYATKCKIRLIKNRFLKIENVINCIKNTPSNEKWNYSSKCLPKLGQLAN